uniref:Uncharacterized protein n=1 Tax=Rhizophora mucronata TaxID=61149 RepID=A0A2P2KR67_RHIMU
MNKRDQVIGVWFTFSQDCIQCIVKITIKKAYIVKVWENYSYNNCSKTEREDCFIGSLPCFCIDRNLSAFKEDS